MTHLLIQADARRIPLANQSVHAVITSPPYWGLRDYGTATWKGGDPACDHEAIPGPVTEKYKVCKCGARRIDAQIGLEATPDCGKHGQVRLRRDLTEAQREYVVQRLLALGLLDV